ncbi:MAG: tripartite tricarboxylate transporter substrate-binding protein [Pseudolabrys sp.]
MDRRKFVAGSAAATAMLGLRPGFAQDAYPSHAITVINPFPPGGASDVVTRPLAAVLEPIVKQPIVIETKAGAAGAVGAQVAASAKPDGYTLLSHITSISGFAEVDKLFGRPVKFTRADSHPDRALRRRSLRTDRQRPAALQDAQGSDRRRQGATGSDHLLVFRPLRRAAYPNGALHEGSRKSEIPASADQWRRPGADLVPRQQCAGAGVVGVCLPRADQGRQGKAFGAGSAPTA